MGYVHEKSGAGGDAIAEPLYALIGEVFDMRGVFKILRKVVLIKMRLKLGIIRFIIYPHWLKRFYLLSLYRIMAGKFVNYLIARP